MSLRVEEVVVQSSVEARRLRRRFAAVGQHPILRTSRVSPPWVRTRASLYLEPGSVERILRRLEREFRARRTQ